MTMSGVLRGGSGSNSHGKKPTAAARWSPTDADRLLVLDVEQRVDEGGGGGGDGSTATAGEGELLLVEKRVIGLPKQQPGCNSHEQAALAKILTYHEEYHQHDDEDGRGDDDAVAAASSSPPSWKKLLKLYRGAVRDCLDGWVADAVERQRRRQRQERNDDSNDIVAADGGAADADDDAAIQDDVNNLGLMRLVYSYMHLSDIFLPLLVERVGFGVGVGGCDGDNPAYDAPGTATADFVRYLRGHHLSKVEEVFPDGAEMLDSEQPEQFGGGGGGGGAAAYYWDLVEFFVLRGCLDHAWYVLQRHSSYVEAALDEEGSDPYLTRTLKEIRDEFHELRFIMLCAPLPGGRSELLDDADDVSAAAAAAAGGEGERYDGDDGGEAPYFDLEVGPSDYRYWDALAGNDPGAETMMMAGGPYFATDNPAIRKHKMWRDYVRQRRRNFPLSRRIPQVDTIMAYMSGDLSSARFDSWQEQLCAELLYLRPELCPRDFTSRIRRIMKGYGDGSDRDTTEIELSIMDGNAGRATEIISLLGGDSYAALPSSLRTLLFSLFIESGILPYESHVARRTDFLCDSATAICSSYREAANSTSNGSGGGGGSSGSIGSTLAIRLLLPYAKQGDRVIVAAIAGILDRHFPESDADAENLLSLCHPLLEMKSAHILDGCTSVVLCRYRYHRGCGNFQDAMVWLLKGVELEDLVVPLADLGSCYKTLTADCNKTAVDLLKIQVGDIPISTEPMRAAMVMVEGLKGDDHYHSAAKNVPAVELLVAVVGMVGNLDSSSKRANHVLSCLEERTDSTTEVRSTLAPWSMHWDLLRVALSIVQDEQTKLMSGESEIPTSAFGKRGITVLMNRLMFVEEFFSPPEEKVAEMREALGIALARAFVAENGQKQLVKKQASKLPWSEKIANIRSCDLKNHPLSIQEKVVQNMLDY